jgi:hypothetical protein
MHPIGGWPSDPGHRAAPFSKPAATLSLPLASTTRGRHFQTYNEHDPSPTIESIRALTPALSTKAADGQPRRARARHRRGRSGSNPTPAIVLSRRAARQRQRDDPIGLPSTWVIARIAGRAT